MLKYISPLNSKYFKYDQMEIEINTGHVIN